jgi:hypothetical protein
MVSGMSKYITAIPEFVILELMAGPFFAIPTSPNQRRFQMSFASTPKNCLYDGKLRPFLNAMFSALLVLFAVSAHNLCLILFGK